MKGERGNIGIFILTHLLVAILVGFFLWSIFPEPWREFLRNGPWGIVAVGLAGGIIVVSIVRGGLARREHKRAHDRVAKVFREATDPRPSGSSIMTGTTPNGCPTLALRCLMCYCASSSRIRRNWTGRGRPTVWVS